MRGEPRQDPFVQYSKFLNFKLSFDTLGNLFSASGFRLSQNPRQVFGDRYQPARACTGSDLPGTIDPTLLLQKETRVFLLEMRSLGLSWT